MNQEILQQIKQRLLNRKQALIKKLSQFADKNPDQQDDYQTKFPNYGDEEEENAAEVATFVNNLSLEQNLETELRKINKALEKIDQGTYGICDKCHRPISEKRLEVQPAATMCIDCQRQAGAR